MKPLGKGLIVKQVMVLIFTMFLFLTCAKDSQENWISLFDGKTFTGWRGLGRTGIPEGHWMIEDGCIKKVATSEVPKNADGQPLEGGDIMTVDSYRDFEFYFEWRISEGGNNGVKYNVSEKLSAFRGSKYSALGFEYQVIDDVNYKGKLNAKQRAASLYDILPAHNTTLKPVGEFNQSRIIFKGNHGEHWLNGMKVLEYELGTAQFDSLIAESKFRDIPNFAEKRKGHIIIQDHTDAAWYRNLKIRLLNSEE